MYTSNLMKILVRAVLAGAVLAASGMGQIRVVPTTERPRPLSMRGLENLQALARLFGYVRYFHPSDAAAAADWEQLAIHSVQTIEKAQSASELAEYLTDALGPVSVAVAVYPTGTAAPAVRLKPGPYLIEWRHHGVGLSENNTYYSERVTRQASGNADEIDLLRADLPGGVSCVVPRVLYTNARGDFRLRNFAGKQPGASADDRSVRLAAVVIAWNVLQHFYPYFDVVHSDWPQALTTALKSAATDEGPIPFLSTLRRMIAALHDGHGRVVHHGGGRNPERGRMGLGRRPHRSDRCFPRVGPHHPARRCGHRHQWAVGERRLGGSGSGNLVRYSAMAAGPGFGDGTPLQPGVGRDGRGTEIGTADSGGGAVPALRARRAR